MSNVVCPSIFYFSFLREEKTACHKLMNKLYIPNRDKIDIYNVLTLRTDVPDHMKSTNGEMTLVEKIQNWAKESPLGKASREKYIEVKTKNNLI